jgi:hypothetical protein
MVERVSATGRFFATGSLRRLLLASFTIAAILLSLVGMHALSAGADAQSRQATHSQMPSALHEGTQTTPSSTDSAPPASAFALLVPIGMVSAGVISAQGCAGMCAMNCLLLGMVCVLSFLVALIGLLVGRLPSPLLLSIRKVTRIPRIAISKFVLPTTPSLNALSISRI